MTGRPLTPPYVPFGIRRFDSLGTPLNPYQPAPNSIFQVVTSYALLRFFDCFPLFILCAIHLSSGSTLLFVTWPTFLVFCGLGVIQPFTLYETTAVSPARFPGTMASADFSTFSRTSLHGLNLPSIHGFIPTAEISPDKNDNFHPIRPVHLHREVRAVLDFALFNLNIA